MRSIRSEREVIDRLSDILNIRSSRRTEASTLPRLDSGREPGSISLSELMILDRQGVCDLDEVDAFGGLPA